MATYSAAHPGLPALASGAADSPAAAIATGQPLNDDDMTAASRQTKRRRKLFEAHPRRATQQEVQEAVKREHCVVSENASGGAGGAPAWAAALQNQLQLMQNQLQLMQNQLQQIQSTQQQLQNQMQNSFSDIKAKQHNATTFEPTHTIQPVRNADDNLPPADINFPATRAQLDALDAFHLRNLLEFYGQPANPQANRLNRLKMHLGIRP